jgi:Arc/MetJ-type ribon-helix-helix transcriptional regulator
MTRNVQRHTGFRIPPDIDKKMDELIEKGEYTTKADIVRTALRFWFDNHDKTPKDQIIEWLESDAGMEYIEVIMKRIAKKAK